MRSIMFLEDEALYGEAIRRLHEMVRKKFHDEVEFTVVPTWVRASEMVLKDRPSVVLMDLTLKADGDSPEMGPDDTLFLFGGVAKDWPPTMVLTGSKFDLDLRRKSFLAGADDFILKEEANRNPEVLCERLYHCFLRKVYDESRA